MENKKKLSLSELQVESFVTSLDASEAQNVEGGTVRGVIIATVLSGVFCVVGGITSAVLNVDCFNI